jgi:excisionase family DNA binding protein
MSEKPKQAILDHVQKPVFTFAEAAALLSLHPLTLRRIAARGELEVVRFGRAVRIPRDALERFVKERRGSQTAGTED